MCKEKNDQCLFTWVILLYIHLQVEIIVDKYAIKLIFCFTRCLLFTRILHTTANLDIAILQTVKGVAEAIARCLYFGIAIWFIMQTFIFWRIWRPFSQIDWAMYLTFSPSWISQIMEKSSSPVPRARFFSTD